MPTRRIALLRTFAACLICASGSVHFGSLWFRELDNSAVNAIVLGAVYLTVGIGLFGRSRFTLFVATALCAVSIAQALRPLPAPLAPVTQLAVAADALAMLCCSAVLMLRWRQAPG